MSAPVTVDELFELESWVKDNNRGVPQLEIARRASVSLRYLMDQELTQKNLLKYLHQQMGIIPKSERGSNSLAKQPGESGVPRAILRQP